MIVRMRSGPTYSGKTAFDIVEQMRQTDFDPPATVTEYMQRAIVRASHFFNVTMRTDPLRGTAAEAATAFIREAIAKGFAEEITEQ